MYKLTLTLPERQAFDWVGDRYCAGCVQRLLMSCVWSPDDVDWDANADITFTVPEHTAWEISELAAEENHLWPCFAPELAAKLNDFCAAIV